MRRRAPSVVTAARATAWWQTAGAVRMPDVRTFLPRRSDYTGVRGGWRSDVLAGLTVGVVALPLALAFGITTGLGAASAEHVRVAANNATG